MRKALTGVATANQGQEDRPLAVYERDKSVSSLTVPSPGIATAYAAVALIPEWLTGGALIAAGAMTYPLVGALGAIPLGLAIGQCYVAHDRAVTVTQHLRRQTRLAEQTRQAAANAPVRMTAVREDVAPVALIERRAS